MLYVEPVKHYQEHFGMYNVIYRFESDLGVGFVPQILSLSNFTDLKQLIFLKENVSQVCVKKKKEPHPVCAPVLRLLLIM